MKNVNKINTQDRKKKEKNPGWKGMHNGKEGEENQSREGGI